MELNEAIKYALDGNAVLFLGSGFSIGAKKSDHSTFKIASSLANKLLHAVDIDENATSDLKLASQIYLQKQSESELVEFLRKEFLAVETSETQKIISKIPWQRVYTTNYDNIFELAALSNSRTYHPVVLSEKTKDFQNKSNIIVHLNGYIEKLTIDKLFNEFKLTNVSYLTEDFEKSDWITLFKSDLSTAKAIFFVGYSMQSDLDINRIIYRTQELANKTFFIMHNRETEINQMFLSSFGHTETIGAEGFAKQIQEISKTYVKITKLPFNSLCFRQPMIGSLPPVILDKDEFDLLVKGVFNGNKLYYSFINKNIYFSIRRSKVKEVVDVIKQGDEKQILLHSDLGNGKTIFVETLASILKVEGFDVFIFNKYRTNIDTEIETICNKYPNAIFIFEDYLSNIELLRILKIHRTTQVLILTERSASNDIGYSDICTYFGDFSCFSLNKLDDEEVNDLVLLLDHYGFWKYFAAQREDQKVFFIKSDCKSQIRNVIVKLLKSTIILNRFQELLNSLRSKKGYYDAILFIMIAQVAKIDIDLEELAEGLDVRRLNNPSFKKDRFVREFVDFDDNEIKMKSSVVAEILLQEVYDSSIVVDLLLDIFKRLDCHKYDNRFRKILRTLITFTNIQHMLNKEDQNYMYNLLRYYENLKKVSFCEHNPHFWLQYAIVKLSERKYDQAQNYFDTAYSYAQKTGYDTYQIDNHYARFILENEMQFGNANTCMKAFEQAHKILMDVRHRKDVRYYPYRVAQNYFPFYEKFFASMTSSEKTIFLNACNDMLNRLEKYVSTTVTDGIHRDVRKAKENLMIILSEQHENN